MTGHGRAARVTIGLAITGVIALVMLVVVRSSAGEPRDRHGRPAIGADSVPRSVEEAEAQGRLHPRTSRTAEFDLPPAVRDSVRIGSAARECVEIGDAYFVRAGEFIAGPFALYRQSWSGGMKLAWFPAHQSRFRRAQVTIRAARLDAPGDARVYLTAALGLEKVFFGREPLTGWAVLPGGRWLLVATSDTNWGCFILTLA